MSPNEARIQIGLNPMEGADDLVIPFTKISDNKINTKNNKSEDEQQ